MKGGDGGSLSGWKPKSEHYATIEGPGLFHETPMYKPPVDPTPEEIAAECAKIRAENEAKAIANEPKEPEPWMKMYRDKKRYKMRKRK